MIALLKKNSAFFIPYFLFLLTGGVWLLCSAKIDIALFINQYHYPLADTFFKYWTYVGTGWLILPVVIILLCVRLRYAIIAVVAFLLSILINDSIKFAVGAPRPAEVLSQMHQAFYIVPGCEVDYWNSFPSGHSVTSFCLFLVLALSIENSIFKFISFIAAFLVAYSRMYLCEHFLIDVYVASVIGTGITILVYYLGSNFKGLNNKRAILDKPVIHLRKT